MTHSPIVQSRSFHAPNDDYDDDGTGSTTSSYSTGSSYTSGEETDGTTSATPSPPRLDHDNSVMSPSYPYNNKNLINNNNSNNNTSDTNVSSSSVPVVGASTATPPPPLGPSRRRGLLAPTQHDSSLRNVGTNSATTTATPDALLLLSSPHPRVPFRRADSNPDISETGPTHFNSRDYNGGSSGSSSNTTEAATASYSNTSGDHNNNSRNAPTRTTTIDRGGTMNRPPYKDPASPSSMFLRSNTTGSSGTGVARSAADVTAAATPRNNNSSDHRNNNNINTQKIPVLPTNDTVRRNNRYSSNNDHDYYEESSNGPTAHIKSNGRGRSRSSSSSMSSDDESESSPTFGNHSGGGGGGERKVEERNVKNQQTPRSDSTGTSTDNRNGSSSAQRPALPRWRLPRPPPPPPANAAATATPTSSSGGGQQQQQRRAASADTPGDRYAASFTAAAASPQKLTTSAINALNAANVAGANNSKNKNVTVPAAVATAAAPDTTAAPPRRRPIPFAQKNTNGGRRSSSLEQLNSDTTTTSHHRSDHHNSMPHITASGNFIGTSSDISSTAQQQRRSSEGDVLTDRPPAPRKPPPSGSHPIQRGGSEDGNVPAAGTAAPAVKQQSPPHQQQQHRASGTSVFDFIPGIFDTLSGKNNRNTSGGNKRTASAPNRPAPRGRPDLRDNASNTSRSSSGSKSHIPPDGSLGAITADRAVQLYSNYLTSYEKREIYDYDDIFYVGVRAKKVAPAPASVGAKVGGGINTSSTSSVTVNFDDESGNYKAAVGDHIAFRYEIINVLGSGSFGQVVRCRDHKRGRDVAVKFIRNHKRSQEQAAVEIRILDHLRQRDPNEQTCVVRMQNYFTFRNHAIIVFDLHSVNLYELSRHNRHKPFNAHMIKSFTTQLLHALALMKQSSVVHCDIKPENILISRDDKRIVKLIDFGSSCFEKERIYTYIQSRFYRAPEVILGMPYGLKIDMWSLACVVAEMQIGYPLFAGNSEQEQMLAIAEVIDLPPSALVNRSPRKKEFFTSAGELRAAVENPKRQPASKQLHHVLRTSDPVLASFLKYLLQWDPMTRPGPDEALCHPYITGKAS